MELHPRREREKAVRREEIIYAAESVFTERGFEGASMDLIAKKADFTKRTLYQYFSSKEELLLAVVASIHRRVLSYYEILLKNEKDSFNRLRAIAYTHLKFAEEFPSAKLLLLSHFISLDPQNPCLLELTEVRNQGLQKMAQLIIEGQNDKSIRQGIDPQTTAISLSFLMIGFFNLILQGKFGASPLGIVDKKSMIDSTIDLLFRGVKA